jgi:hypothetical protein
MPAKRHGIAGTQMTPNIIHIALPKKTRNIYVGDASIKSKNPAGDNFQKLLTDLSYINPD